MKVTFKNDYHFLPQDSTWFESRDLNHPQTACRFGNFCVILYDPKLIFVYLNVFNLGVIWP